MNEPKVDAACVTGAPGMIVLGDSTYSVSQPTPGEMGAIVSAMKKHSKDPVRALREDPDFQLLPEDERAKMLTNAARRKLTSVVPLDPMSALEALTSLPIVQFVAWVMLRKGDPTFTMEKARQLITEENRLEVSVELDTESCMGKLGNEDGQSG